MLRKQREERFCKKTRPCGVEKTKREDFVEKLGRRLVHNASKDGVLLSNGTAEKTEQNISAEKVKQE